MQTISGDAPRICTTCDVRHYENCEFCWGFGLVAKAYMYDPQDGINHHLPVKGGESHNPPPWISCPNCGSTPSGVPK